MVRLVSEITRSEHFLCLERKKKEKGMIMDTVKYSMSFTTGGLFCQESVKITQLYLEIHDWEQVRKDVVVKNMLQARTISTLKRVCREICSRLKTLNDSELTLLVQGTNQERSHILWVAICRRYRFIRDFAIEVIRERYLTFRQNLQVEDYEAFFNSRAEWHIELEAITTTTRNKLRQVLFRMLRETELLSVGNTITPAMLTPRFISIISQSRDQDFLVFPLLDLGVKG